MKISELDTTKARSEVIRIDLEGYILKIGLKKVDLSGQWIDILPTDSDIFNDAKLEQFRKAAKGVAVDTNELIGCLIVDWSFEEECSLVNKVKAIKTFPRSLVEFIDKTASQAINFMTI
jgi:hypothetical protein